MSSIGPEIPAHLLQPSSSSLDDDDDEPGPSVPVSTTTTTTAGPQIPAHLLNPEPTVENDDGDGDEDDYAPALPPDLLTKPPATNTTKRVSGPSFPPSLSPHPNQYDDDDDDDFGPQPLPSHLSSSHRETDGVKQFLELEEKRRKNAEEAAKPKVAKRDEWMLVPPSAGDVLSNIDPTRLKKARTTFNASSSAPADRDTTLWTETPQERAQRIKDEVAGKKRKAVNKDVGMSEEEALEARKRARMEEGIRRGVEEHTKQHRGSALVDLHAKSSKSKGDEEEDKGIWDHARDMSLGGRLMDDSQRKKMLRDAKGLGERFGSGTGGGYM